MTAIPEEIVYPLPPSLIPSRTYEYRSSPSNSNTFNTEGAVIQLPLALLPRSFYQNNTIYVRGRFNPTYIVAAENDATQPPMSFTSAGAYSLFSRQATRTSSGITLENIQNPAVLTNIQMAYGLTPAERVGMSAMTKCAPTASTNLGVGTSLGWGLNLSAPAGHGSTIEFCIPLNSILTNGEKFIPAWYDELTIELTIASLISAAGAQNPTFITHRTGEGINAFTITDVEICAQVLELGPTEFNTFMSAYPNGITVKSQSYVYGSGTLPAQTGAGNVDITYSHKQQSIKQFIMAVSPSTAAEGIYSGVNPNLTDFSLTLNGVSYPQRPIRALLPSESYAQNQKSWGALMSDLKCGSVPMEYHAVASAAYNLYHDAFRAHVVGAAALAGTRVSDFVTKSNKCFFMLDLESINGSKQQLFNGVSTTGSGTSSLIRLNIGATLANTPHTVQYFSVYDALIKFDPVTGITVVS